MAIRNTNCKENEPTLENGKKKNKEDRPATKVVVRRLPPTMTEEQFKMQISPLPEIDYFYFVSADMSLTPNAFSRAYINFVDQADLFIFTQKFDGYVFIDSKGGEFPAVVEFAPFQRIPKNRPNRKKDTKVGTIEADPIYIAFKEQLEADNLENRTAANASKQHFFETSLVPEKKELNNTPLLDFIKNKRAERQRIRDEKREEKRKKDLERRRAKEELRRTKKEDDASVVKTFFSTPEIPKSDSYNSSTIPNLESKQKVRSSTIDCNNHVSKNSSNNSIDEKKVTKNVHDLVHFFNNANNTNLIRNSKDLNFLQNVVTHTHIEKELHKTMTNKPESLIHYKKSSCYSPKYRNTSTPPLGFKECNYLSSCDNFYQLKKTKSTELVGSNQITKEPKIPKDIITDESTDREEHTSTVFSAQAFKKNLQKVVKDVLGSTDVKQSVGNTINKPKTFVQRVLIGSGEQCARPGFNSPLFYLPPRAYGCGPNQGTNSSPQALKGDTIFNKVQSTSSSGLVKNNCAMDHCEIFLRKPLSLSAPYLSPFSNKFISLSKSDDTIESTENPIKMGGSHENLKTKIEPLAFRMKSHLHRPNVMPKRPISTNKDYSITR